MNIIFFVLFLSLLKIRKAKIDLKRKRVFHEHNDFQKICKKKYFYIVVPNFGGVFLTVNTCISLFGPVPIWHAKIDHCSPFVQWDEDVSYVFGLLAKCSICSDNEWTRWFANFAHTYTHTHTLPTRPHPWLSKVSFYKITWLKDVSSYKQTLNKYSK